MTADYQGLVTKWREQVKVLHRNADNSSYEYARAIFREQAQRIEQCADELAEVIARNVQPSPDWTKELLEYSSHWRSCPMSGWRPLTKGAECNCGWAELSKRIAEARPEFSFTIAAFVVFNSGFPQGVFPSEKVAKAFADVHFADSPEVEIKEVILSPAACQITTQKGV